MTTDESTMTLFPLLSLLLPASTPPIRPDVPAPASTGADFAAVVRGMNLSPIRAGVTPMPVPEGNTASDAPDEETEEEPAFLGKTADVPTEEVSSELTQSRTEEGLAAADPAFEHDPGPRHDALGRPADTYALNLRSPAGGKTAVDSTHLLPMRWWQGHDAVNVLPPGGEHPIALSLPAEPVRQPGEVFLTVRPDATVEAQVARIPPPQEGDEVKSRSWPLPDPYRAPPVGGSSAAAPVVQIGLVVDNSGRTNRVESVAELRPPVARAMSRSPGEVEADQLPVPNPPRTPVSAASASETGASSLWSHSELEGRILLPMAGRSSPISLGEARDAFSQVDRSTEPLPSDPVQSIRDLPRPDNFARPHERAPLMSELGRFRTFQMSRQIEGPEAPPVQQREIRSGQAKDAGSPELPVEADPTILRRYLPVFSAQVDAVAPRGGSGAHQPATGMGRRMDPSEAAIHLGVAGATETTPSTDNDAPLTARSAVPSPPTLASADIAAPVPARPPHFFGRAELAPDVARPDREAKTPARTSDAAFPIGARFLPAATPEPARSVRPDVRPAELREGGLMSSTPSCHNQEGETDVLRSAAVTTLPVERNAAPVGRQVEELWNRSVAPDHPDAPDEPDSLHAGRLTLHVQHRGRGERPMSPSMSSESRGPFLTEAQTDQLKQPRSRPTTDATRGAEPLALVSQLRSTESLLRTALESGGCVQMSKPAQPPDDMSFRLAEFSAAGPVKSFTNETIDVRSRSDLTEPDLFSLDGLKFVNDHASRHGLTATGSETRPIPFSALPREIAIVSEHRADGLTEIRLDPPELGRVRIALQTSEAGVALSILVERPEAADLVRRQIDGLAAELRALGYSGVDISLSGGEAGRQSGDQAPRPGDPSLARPSSDIHDTEPVLPPAAPGTLDLRL